LKSQAIAEKLPKNLTIIFLVHPVNCMRYFHARCNDTRLYTYSKNIRDANVLSSSFHHRWRMFCENIWYFQI